MDNEKGLYEVWAGIDKAQLVTIKEFEDDSEATNYAVKLGEEMYSKHPTCPSYEDFAETSNSDEEAQKAYADSLSNRIEINVGIADSELYEKCGGDIYRYQELLVDKYGDGVHS